MTVYPKTPTNLIPTKITQLQQARLALEKEPDDERLRKNLDFVTSSCLGEAA